MSRIFDSHLHIIDPRFPLVANQGYLPGSFTTLDYHSQIADLKQTTGYEIAGGAIVAGSFQAFDQMYLEAALAELGPGFVGVTQLPADTADKEILRLHAIGVRAIRCNLFRGGPVDLAEVDRFSRRVFEIAGWHTELYVDARSLWDADSSSLSVLGRTVSNLPVASIDHLGMYPDGLPALLELAGRGVRIKATGFGRLKTVAIPDFDISKTIREIVHANPAALLFGTDLPGTRAPRPFQLEDLALLRDALADFDDVQLERVLYQNAVDFYRIAS